MLSHRIGSWTGSKAPWALQEQTGSEFSIGELDTPYLQMYNLVVGSFPGKSVVEGLKEECAKEKMKGTEADDGPASCSLGPESRHNPANRIA